MLSYDKNIFLFISQALNRKNKVLRKVLESSQSIRYASPRDEINIDILEDIFHHKSIKILDFSFFHPPKPLISLPNSRTTILKKQYHQQIGS